MLEILERRKGELAGDYAGRILRHNIVNLNLSPGQQLSEPELAAEIGVSRTPIREALLNLKRIGAIEVYPQSGTFVSLIDYRLAEDVRYMRCLVECDLAEKASRIKSQEHILKMYENIQLQKLYISRDPGKYFELDNEFHRQLYLMSGKEALFDLIEERAVCFDRLRVLSHSLSYTSELVSEHEEIVCAIENGDGKKAAEIMEKHLTRAIKDNESLRNKFPEYYKSI